MMSSYRTPSFGARRERNYSTDGEIKRSGYSASTSQLDRVHMDSQGASPMLASKDKATPQRSSSISASTITLSRTDSIGSSGSSGSGPSVERSGSFLSKYVPLSERLKMKSSTLSSGSNGAGDGNNNSSLKTYSSILSDRRQQREAFLMGGTTPGSGDTARKYDRVSRDDNRASKEKELDKERVLQQSSTSSITSYHQSQHEKPHKETDGYVGFANLPNQVYRKSVKKGFEFTLMVVGESGLGKSTLINSMFLTDLYSSEYPGPSHRIKQTVAVEPTQVVLKEGGVQLRLTVVDTPGFGDAVDNSNCWQPVTEFIEHKYEEYLNSESRVNRKVNADTRVHCCLYFIAPNGHGLKPLDVEFMKRLHDKVNIIPLIAKSDTMTPDECREFKKTILNEIAQHKIKIYEFPDPDDDEEAKIQKKLKDRVPFAVVGSNTVVDSNGRKVRGRVYPWGVVEVENLEHNDFIALRNMLIRTHMQDLKDVTNNVHYENYRYNKLASVTSSKGSKSGGKNPLLQMEEEKKEHVNKMKKMEAEMEQVFEMKVKEKMQKLKDSEADLERRADQMKKSLEQQAKELEDKRRAFEHERDAFEAQEEERRRSLEALKKHKKSLF